MNIRLEQLTRDQSAASTWAPARPGDGGLDEAGTIVCRLEDTATSLDLETTAKLAGCQISLPEVSTMNWFVAQITFLVVALQALWPFLAFVLTHKMT